MRECGFDSVKIDAVGNVVGVYRAADAGREDAADRLALRHRSKRRPLRRPPRHLRADDRGARAEPGRPAPAVRARARRLRRGGRPALQGDLPRLGRARRPVRSEVARPGRRRRRVDARRDAPRRPAGEPARDREAQAQARRLPRLRRGPHRAGAGAERARPAARRRHLDQRRRPLRRRGARHGEPRRHDADGEPARRRRGRRRARRLPREARAAKRRTWSARWACSKCRTDRPTSFPAAASSRSTSAPPPTPCATPASTTCSPSCEAICDRRGLVVLSRGNDARRRIAVGARVADALGARRRRAGPAGAPHAERRRPRRDEDRRGDGAGDAVRSRRERRHQPQPARIEHRRRHAAGGRGLPAAARRPRRGKRSRA